jgi:phospholipase D-like protein
VGGVLLFDAGGLLFLVVFGLWVFALVDCISTPAPLCRNLPKGLWIILIVLLWGVGALLWVLAGRPVRRRLMTPTDYSQPRRPIAMEDSPHYTAVAGVTDRRSAELDRQIDEWEERQRELDRREAELREREREVQEREGKLSDE